MNNEETMKHILSTARTVASVGLSANPQKDSNEAGQYLKDHGYKVIPVNPTATEILGEKSYPSLADVPEKIDVVQIFRKSEDVPPIVEEAIRIGAQAVWMQEDIVNEQAAERAREAGLMVVMGVCMKKTHRRLFGSR